jgi:hypothetical protein
MCRKVLDPCQAELQAMQATEKMKQARCLTPHIHG